MKIVFSFVALPVVLAFNQHVKLNPMTIAPTTFSSTINPFGQTNKFQPRSPYRLNNNLEYYTDTSTSSLFATTAADIDIEDEPSSPPFPVVIWRFTRPHTIIGSAMAIPTIHMLAAPTISSIFTLPMLMSMVYAMVPALLMNLYITGLNQITDVEIDKINKPYLPIPAGELTEKKAKKVVTVSLILSLLLGVAHPIFGTNGLNVALWGSAILGTMYSLPPFRLKRFPALAAFCIVAVRGAIVNAGFYAHANAAAFGNPGGLTTLGCLLTDKKCFLSSLFFGVFGIVIALMKDVPDVKGDELANIRSFSVRVGQKTIFHSMRRLVSSLFYVFGLGFLQGSISVFKADKVVSLCRGSVAAFSFYFGLCARAKGKDVNAEDSKEVYNYYMYLWKLFYASYFALPFSR